MKITHVKPLQVPVPAADPPFRWRDGLAGSGPKGDGAVPFIGTDTGAAGVAFLSRAGAYAMLSDLTERVFGPELIGADPLQREWLGHRVGELDRIHELPLPALGLIDTALWDLAARQQRMPVWQLLGGYRTEMAISNTTYYESPVTSNPARREAAVDADGTLRAPTAPGISGPAGFDYPTAIAEYVS